MASNPIKGLSDSDPLKHLSDPGKTSPGEHRKIERIKKTDDIDPEKPGRRNFKSFLEEGPEELPDSKLPSPLELFESKLQSSKKSDPFNLNASPSKKDLGEKSLPQSDEFWTHIDEPFNEPPEDPLMIETQTEEILNQKKGPDSTHLGIPIKKPEKERLSEPESQKKRTSFESPRPQSSQSEPALPSSPLSNTNHEEEIVKGARPANRPSSNQKPIEREEQNSPISRFLDREETSNAAPQEPRKKLRAEESKEETSDATQNIGNVPSLPQQFEETGDRERRKKETPIEEIVLPSSQPLPLDVAPMAMTATKAAEPILKTEATSLFYQMVGTIYMMTKPSGVSRTEIVLNNPSYSDSKFFGASIIIEKYASAPDSFNIRLTGSNEAVAAFQQNIPTLVNSFRKGNFSFKIGRIEAEYKAEKPMFRRRERNEGTDSDNEFTGQER